MAKSDYVGLIDCPLCGNDRATVHQQQSGTKKGRFYYRCYSEVNGAVMRCGTIQCIGPTGQDFIAAKMRPIGHQEAPPPEEPAPAPEPIGEPEPAPAPEPETEKPPARPIGQEKRGGGLLSNFLQSIGDDA